MLTNIQKKIVEMTTQYVKQALSEDSTGHDWQHVHRVHKTACYIARHEQVDLFVVELGALLHDIADWKFHNGDINIGVEKAKNWLDSLDVSKDVIEHVGNIIFSISFKGAKAELVDLSIEAAVVQDADRLDALGAIGIGRTFAYGGFIGRPLYDTEIPPCYHKNFEEYKQHKGTTLNHFYEKLFLLAERMNTNTGKELAQKKHKVMENFVNQFLDEWNVVY